MRYLVDSDVLISLERYRSPELLAKFIGNDGLLSVSPISVAEMFYGAGQSRNPEAARESLRGLLVPLSVPELTVADAEQAADIRVELHNAGTPIGRHDMLIAAQARSRGLILVTGNTREFERVPGLRIENWLEQTPQS